MKRFVLAAALTCALSAIAIAGEIPSTGVVSPPPDGDIPTSDSASPGEMPTCGLSALLTILDLAF